MAKDISMAQQDEHPKRGRGKAKGRGNQAPNPAELLDFAASPHLKGMTPTWQLLYAAIKRSVKT